MWQFYWEWFTTAFNGAWAISQGIAGAVAILGGIVVWRLPHWETQMKNLLWMIPLGIFLILLVIRLVIAPYDIYNVQQKTQNELRAQLDTAKKEAFATPDQLIGTQFTGLQIRLVDLAREDIVIRNKTFVDCYFYGPAVVSIGDYTAMNNPVFHGVNNTVEDFFIVVQTPRILIGVMQFDHCVFQNCHFLGISIIGSEQVLQQIKASMRS